MIIWLGKIDYKCLVYIYMETPVIFRTYCEQDMPYLVYNIICQLIYVHTLIFGQHWHEYCQCIICDARKAGFGGKKHVYPYYFVSLMEHFYWQKPLLTWRYLEITLCISVSFLFERCNNLVLCKLLLLFNNLILFHRTSSKCKQRNLWWTVW